MQTPVTMEALAEPLAVMGFVIAPHGDHIGLRLSLWTSVRVHVTDGRLSGTAPQARALDVGQPVFSMQDLRVHTPVK